MGFFTHVSFNTFVLCLSLGSLFSRNRPPFRLPFPPLCRYNCRNPISNVPEEFHKLDRITIRLQSLHFKLPEVYANIFINYGWIFANIDWLPREFICSHRHWTCVLMLCFVSKPTPQSLCNTVSEFSCRIQCVNSDKSQLQLKVRNNKLGENYRGSLRKFPLQAWRKMMCTA